MPLTMPLPEPAILARRDDLVARLRRFCPAHNVIDEETELPSLRMRRARPCIAQLPLVVALPETVEQVTRIMALAAEMNVKIVPRGGRHLAVWRLAAAR